MAAQRNPVDQAADELYGLAPGEFTRARDERVKALRAGGDRDAAGAVKALRRPTVAAWAANKLSRRRRKDLDRLLAAGEQLRAAQDELLGGGDRAAFARAAAAERELVAELAAAAIELAADEGERGTGLHEKVAETLHAAALDEETAAQLDAGRLAREREAIGGFGAASSAPAEAGPKASRPQKARSGGRRARARSSANGGRAAKGSKPSAAGRLRAEAADRLAAAEGDEREARRDLDVAARAAQHLTERAETARTRAEAAQGHARELAERADQAARRADAASERAEEAGRDLDEARKAEKGARRAHERAERALKAAASKAG